MTGIYRTVYRVEVFSQGPFDDGVGNGDPFGLAQINYAITEGDCIGNVEVVSAEQVPPNEVQAHLLRIGNDGTFFEEV